MVFQDPFASLNPRKRVSQIIGMPLRLHGASRDEIETACASCCDRVGLHPEHLHRYPHEFSGGQRQRIGVARALALEPRLIVLDEPVSALDVSVQAQIINLLDDLQDDFGLTYLFVAHDLSVVRHVSDRIAVMYLGKLMEVSPAEELYTKPIHPYTGALLAAIPIPDPRENRRARAGRGLGRAAQPDRPALRLRLPSALPARDRHLQRGRAAAHALPERAPRRVPPPDERQRGGDSGGQSGPTRARTAAATSCRSPPQSSSSAAPDGPSSAAPERIPASTSRAGPLQGAWRRPRTRILPAFAQLLAPKVTRTGTSAILRIGLCTSPVGVPMQSPTNMSGPSRDRKESSNAPEAVERFYLGTAPRRGPSFLGQGGAMRRTIDLLRAESRARIFFAVLTQSAWGTGAGYVALLLVAYERFESAWAISIVLIADLVAPMLLGPGVRSGRRPLVAPACAPWWPTWSAPWPSSASSSWTASCPRWRWRSSPASAPRCSRRPRWRRCRASWPGSGCPRPRPSTARSATSGLAAGPALAALVLVGGGTGPGAARERRHLRRSRRWSCSRLDFGRAPWRPRTRRGQLVPVRRRHGGDTRRPRDPRAADDAPRLGGGALLRRPRERGRAAVRDRGPGGERRVVLGGRGARRRWASRPGRSPAAPAGRPTHAARPLPVRAVPDRGRLLRCPGSRPGSSCCS